MGRSKPQHTSTRLSHCAAFVAIVLVGTAIGSSQEQTLQRCLDAAAGDTCTLGAGVFEGTVSLSKSGTSDRPIRIVGAGVGDTVIKGGVTVSGDYVVIQDLTVNMKARQEIGISLAGRFGHVTNVLVTSDETMLGQNNVGVRLAGSHNTLSNSRIEETCFGVSIVGDGHVMTRTEVTRLWAHGARCGGPDYVRLFGSGHRLLNNRLHEIDRSKSPGAHIDCFQTFDVNGPDRAVRDIVIDGNWCADVTQGVMFEAHYYQLSRDVVIRNNVFTRVGAWCALLERIANVSIVNNTCDTSTAHHGLWCRGVGGSCEFKNNILYGTGTAYGSSRSAELIDGRPNAPGKNNLLFSPTGNRSFAGYDDDIVNRDPELMDRLTSDFRLRPSSPARDAGLAIGTWLEPVDQDGTRRPQGVRWDIGAYEYRVSPPTPPRQLRILGD